MDQPGLPRTSERASTAGLHKSSLLLSEASSRTLSEGTHGSIHVGVMEQRSNAPGKEIYGTVENTAPPAHDCKPSRFLQVPHFSLHIDMSLKDLMATIGSSIVPWQRSYIERCAVNTWSESAKRINPAGHNYVWDPNFEILKRSLPQPVEDQVLITLSARTALDLWLRVKNFPRGSVVLMSAINIPSMVSVLEHHGLVALPIDLDLDTLEPLGLPNSMTDVRSCFLGRLISSLGVTKSSIVKEDTFNKHTGDVSLSKYGKDPNYVEGLNTNLSSGRNSISWTSDDSSPGKVCCILAAHLYGRRFHSDAIACVAQHFDVPLIEDLAEAYTDGSYSGHQLAALTLFSFGTIKNSTAFGGGISRVTCPITFSAMQHLHEKYPVQKRGVFLKKTTKNAVIMTLLQSPLGVSIANSARVLGVDLSDTIVQAVRGFPGPLIPSIRAKPSTPQVATLTRRLSDSETAAENNARTNLCAELLESTLRSLKADVQFVSLGAYIRNHWLYPLLVRHPVEFTKRMSILGVEVYRGATQLSIVACPHLDIGSSTSTESSIRYTVQKLQGFPLPASGEAFMNYVVYLPLNRRCSEDTVLKLANIIREAAGADQNVPIIDTKKMKLNISHAYDSYISRLHQNYAPNRTLVDKVYTSVTQYSTESEANAISNKEPNDKQLLPQTSRTRIVIPFHATNPLNFANGKSYL